MAAEKRTVRCDSDLGIEAYHFQGIMQKFPNHFHEYYVFGFIEKGCRLLNCRNKRYKIYPGDVLIFNPLDNHACAPADNNTLDWRCISIQKPVMRRMAKEITGRNILPRFSPNVVPGSDLVPVLKDLHRMILAKNRDFKKEETFYFFIEQLLTLHMEQDIKPAARIREEIQAACDYMEKNYTDTISLDDLSHISGLNKYTLLRNFTIQRGITPYQYLSAIRVNKAKKLLETGISPLEAALRTGYTDQSHFTRFFKNFIGLTPKMYQDIYTGSHIHRLANE